MGERRRGGQYLRLVFCQSKNLMNILIVGMGDIAHFYVFPIFWLNGFMISLFFVLGAYLRYDIFFRS